MTAAPMKRYRDQVVRKPLVAVRLDEELIARLDDFVKRYPGTTRPALLKAAIELGLAELEARHSGKRRK
jgi:metal-responsive CopG/Arc/MetJ family transcriptional regulator